MDEGSWNIRIQSSRNWSFLSLTIPEKINRFVFTEAKCLMFCERTANVILAIARSYVLSTRFAFSMPDSSTRNKIDLGKSFSSQLDQAALTALGSISSAKILFTPSFASPIDRIPEPVPISQAESITNFFSKNNSSKYSSISLVVS